MREDGRVFEWEAEFYRKDGSRIWTSTNARAVRDPASGELLGYEGTVEDITERKKAEEALRRSLDRLVALHEAGILLGSTLELEEAGARLLEIMRRISGFTAAAISMPAENGRLAVWRSIGLEDLGDGVRQAPGARRAKEDAIERDATQIFEPAYGQGAAVGLCLPLKVRERAVGVLEVYGPEELAEKDNVKILESLTNQAASALENARLYGELAEREKRLQELVGKILVAQEEERRRVAYEVHDGLAQVAAAAHQHLQAFAHYHPPPSEEGREDLKHVSELVRQTVGEARRIIADLRPTALDDFGLRSAIRLHLDALRADGWSIDYEDGLDDERLPAATETAIFRVVQEALNNVGKHAGTRRVDIALQKRSATSLAGDGRGRIRLKIRDYGRGFVPGSSRGGPGERVGLTGMRERITLLGGEFRVASRPGEGTLIIAEIPLLDGPEGAVAHDVVGRPAVVVAEDFDGK
jgi:signal transduction histidine kinase